MCRNIAGILAIVELFEGFFFNKMGSMPNWKIYVVNKRGKNIQYLDGTRAVMGNSSPRGPDSGGFLCPTRQKPLSPNEVDPQMKAISTCRREKPP